MDSAALITKPCLSSLFLCPATVSRLHAFFAFSLKNKITNEKRAKQRIQTLMFSFVLFREVGPLMSIVSSPVRGCGRTGSRRTLSRATRGGECLAPTTCATSPLDSGSFTPLWANPFSSQGRGVSGTNHVCHISPQLRFVLPPLGDNTLDANPFTSHQGREVSGTNHVCHISPRLRFVHPPWGYSSPTTG